MTDSLNWAIAACMALGLGMAHHLDAETVTDFGLADAQKQARAEARRERAAAEVCFKTLGLGSRPQWRDDGVLECVPKRGRVVVAGGA